MSESEPLKVGPEWHDLSRKYGPPVYLLTNGQPIWIVAETGQFVAAVGDQQNPYAATEKRAASRTSLINTLNKLASTGTRIIEWGGPQYEPKVYEVYATKIDRWTGKTGGVVHSLRYGYTAFPYSERLLKAMEEEHAEWKERQAAAEASKRRLLSGYSALRADPGGLQHAVFAEKVAFIIEGVKVGLSPQPQSAEEIAGEWDLAVVEAALKELVKFGEAKESEPGRFRLARSEEQ